ncbi:MAG TPA: hypothetical protein IGS52_14495 [Oscillatoriaceae cyanobacterium M33_DOE_052]|uniref:Uncharacterized protein n=1 Tax=Planktothricoides sp. SpSt-374 TaxID=2282167 RepID=A0A7C3ZL56_9CYAN|nr:hypothetical protein [Oscillatoriaceae cyanobacterium M33_DOE_052]
MSGSREQGLSIYRLRWIGYGLLAFAIIDVLLLLYPPQLTNAVWQLQTMGQIVERLPVPLMGLALVFFGDSYDRSRLEDNLVKLLSWVSLLLAVAFLVMVPLGAVNTLRINTQNNQQITAQAEGRLQELKQVEEQVSAGTTADLRNMAQELNRMGLPVDVNKPEELKTEILSRIGIARDQLPRQTEATRNSQRLVLLKNSAKWNLGALISSVLFFYIWKGTDWAR